MCRFMSLVSKPKLNDKYRELLDVFTKMSEYDVFLEKITSGRRKSHGDGWGLAGVGVIRDTPAILFHKSILPIYHSVSRDVLELFMNRIKRYETVYLVIHARLSSASEPYGERYTHPFEVEIGDSGNYLWLVHNGGVNKRELGKEIGLTNPYYYTDSWVTALYIARYLEKCVSSPDDIENCIVTAYTGITKYVVEGSALNTGLLLFWNGKPYLYTTYYYREGGKDGDRKEYYQLHMYIDEHNGVIASSTIRNYIDNVKPVDNGIYRVEVGKVIKIHVLG